MYWKAEGRLNRISDAKGKTIEFAHCKSESLGIKFTDGTYYFAEAQHDGDPNDVSAWVEEEDDIAHRDAFYVGLISREDLDAYETAAQTKGAAEQEARDRQQYERLKAQFEEAK